MRERDQVLREIWRRPSPFKGSDLPHFSCLAQLLVRIYKDDLISTKGVTSLPHPTIFSDKQWLIKTLLFSGSNGENKHSLKQWCGFTRSTNEMNNHKRKHSPQEHNYIFKMIFVNYEKVLLFSSFFPPPLPYFPK